MKKNFTFKAVLLTALFIVFGFALKAQTNLIVNPSFEDGFSGWFLGPKDSYTEPVIETSGAKDGSKFAHYASPSATTGFYQNINVTVDKTYVLSFWYKATGDNTDARLWSFLKDAGDKNVYTTESESTDPLRTNNLFLETATEWTYHEVTFTVPEKVVYLQLAVRAYSGGTVSYDHFSLTESSSTTPLLSATPSSLSFSSSVNNSSDSQVIKVLGANLTKTPTYSISGTDAAMFAASGTLTTSGGDIAVTFTPTSDGSKSATLNVMSGDLTKTIVLSGMATSTGNPYGLDDTNPLSMLNEDFESGLPATWKTAAEQGDRNWGQRTYNDNGYMQMSAYKGTGAYKTLLISPALDFDKISKNNVRFDWKAGYANGATLKVSVMTKDGTKTEVKSIKATEPSGGYAANFATETLDLSAQSGIKFLVFEYNGDADASQTTTYQIDNVRVELAQSIDQVQSTLKIYAFSGQLYIENDGSAKTIQVYNVLGRKLLEKTATAGLNTIAVEKGQLLIVKAGKKVAKVIVK